MVGGIIILIIFFVMKDTPEFADEMFWIFSGAELVILSLASVGCVGGFIQVKYRTRAIITRGLYNFYPLLEVQKRFFKRLFS